VAIVVVVDGKLPLLTFSAVLVYVIDLNNCKYNYSINPSGLKHDAVVYSSAERDPVLNHIYYCCKLSVCNCCLSMTYLS